MARQLNVTLTTRHDTARHGERAVCGFTASGIHVTTTTTTTNTTTNTTTTTTTTTAITTTTITTDTTAVATTVVMQHFKAQQRLFTER